MKEFDVPSRLEELERLEDGWLDGEGRALDKRGIRWFVEMFERSFPNDLPLPYIYPTADGNIQLEWTLGNYELSLKVDLINRLGEWQAVNVETDEEEYYELHLDRPEEWEKVCSRLLRIQKPSKQKSKRLINAHSVDNGQKTNKV